MNQTCKIIIFAKAPTPGYAKTRLAAALGAQAAAQLAARMLRETLQRALEADLGPIELCCAPDHAHVEFALAQSRHGVQLSSQGEGDLGSRMQDALRRALQSHARALLIGTDVPALTARLLRQAAKALSRQPAVFAPTADGGYALVGLAREIPGLFDDIAWSTPQVMRQTRLRLAAQHIAATELATLHDVDDAADLIHVPKQWLI